MPTKVNVELIIVWACVGFFTGAGWAVATWLVGRILGLDSSINSQPIVVRCYSNTRGLDPPDQHQNDNDDQNRADEADATVTITVTVPAETTTEATEQKNDEDDNEDESQRHGFVSVCCA